MLDQKWIRGDLDDLASRLRKKGFELDAGYLSSAEQERKAAQTQMDKQKAVKQTSTLPAPYDKANPHRPPSINSKSC